MSGFIDGICLARGVGVAAFGGFEAGGEKVGGGHGHFVVRQGVSDGTG